MNRQINKNGTITKADYFDKEDINNAEHPTRKLAIEILEAIAEAYGSPDMFDGSEVLNEDGTITKCEPDGSWYEYEDLIVDILRKGMK